MIIVKISSGLGNQLFQYAFGRAISIQGNSVLKLERFPQDNIELMLSGPGTKITK